MLGSCNQRLLALRSLWSTDTWERNGRKKRSRERNCQVQQRTGPWQRTEPYPVLLLFSLVAMPDHKPTSISWVHGFRVCEACIFSLSKVFFASHLCQPLPPSSELSALSLPDWSDEQSDHQKRHHNWHRSTGHTPGQKITRMVLCRQWGGKTGHQTSSLPGAEAGEYTCQSSISTRVTNK